MHSTTLTHHSGRKGRIGVIEAEPAVVNHRHEGNPDEGSAQGAPEEGEQVGSPGR